MTSGNDVIAKVTPIRISELDKLIEKQNSDEEINDIGPNGDGVPEEIRTDGDDHDDVHGPQGIGSRLSLMRTRGNTLGKGNKNTVRKTGGI